MKKLLGLLLVVSGLNAQNPLYQAIEDGEEAEAIAMIDAGADVHARSAGRPFETVLARACYGSGVNLRIVRYLLERGADPRVGDYSGLTPLHDTDDIEVMELLLTHAPTLVKRLTVNGDTPLHYAAMQEQPEKVELLLRYGADPGAENLDGETPIAAYRRKVSRPSSRITRLLNLQAHCA